MLRYLQYNLISLVLIVVLICISLIISGIEHFFMCLLATCISSLEKCLFRSPAHVFFGWVVFCFDIELYELFMYSSWKLIPCQSYALQIFSSSVYVLDFVNLGLINYDYFAASLEVKMFISIFSFTFKKILSCN